MIGVLALLQRVRQAQVHLEARVVADIGVGLVCLVCAEQGDSEQQADRLLDKILKLRIFADEAGKMNRSVQNLDGHGSAGSLLIVSQFTLAADTSGGNRPSFTNAAPPHEGRRLYEHLVQRARQAHSNIQTGEFGANMQLHLINDGPVTIPLRIVP